MPSFSEDQVSDDELEAIAHYVSSLEGEGHAHIEPVGLGVTVEMHHWMALEALKAEDRPEAIHHVRHIIELLEEGEHSQRMEAIIDSLLTGDTHEPEHEIEGMLAGSASPDLTLVELHLRQALVALTVRDLADIRHHVEHFHELAKPGEERRWPRSWTYWNKGSCTRLNTRSGSCWARENTPTRTTDCSSTGRQFEVLLSNWKTYVGK